MTKFAHLHLHTDHSFLDGVGRSAEYAALAASAGHAAIAITDHGNLYGIPAHWRACEKLGIKPIAGCELYVNDDRSNREAPRGKQRQEAVAKGTVDPTFVDSHLVVLCENDTGWKNLLKINHDSVKEGYYYKPRTTNAMVLSHAEGLVATTACFGSAFSQYARTGELRKLRKLLGDYRDAFGVDHFYREVHISELAEQAQVNEMLGGECDSLKIKPILAADVHYACVSDASRQDEMIAVSRHTPLAAPDSFKLEARHLYFWSVNDVYELSRKFGYRYTKRDLESWMENAADLSARLNTKPLGDGKLKPPAYILPDGTPCTTPMVELKRQTVEGFNARFDHIKPQDRGPYIERIRHELGIIDRCGMADFYLVTADVARECRARRIRYWTRGSGCASLVAAAVGITPIDPLRFSLLFERFVDPSRPNAPDFDMDVDASRRDELAQWLKEKYGGQNGERIARISSISTFGIKSAIRDVCFAHGVDSSLAYGVSEVSERLEKSIEDRLFDAVPVLPPKADPKSTPIRLEAIAEGVKALVETGDSRVARLVQERPDVLDAALNMVGRARGRNLHAAGYVVAPGPLSDYLPVDRIGSGDEAVIVSAWGEGQASQDISPTGLLKIDLLSLETVAVVAEIVKDVVARSGKPEAEVEREIDPIRMDFYDPAVLHEFATSVGFGLHQLAALDQTLAKYVARLKPKSVDEVVAAIALYRPGSMEFVESFLKRARGLEPVETVEPVFDRINAETYGFMVYQEQVMQVLHQMGGIPLRDAYSTIKAISKKDHKKIDGTKAQFVAGAVARGTRQELAEHLFELVQKFAGYGFNKAHAASYAVLSYQTAKLRASYPMEFWKAWLNWTPNEAGKDDVRKIELIMRAASHSGIRVVPPLIGHSASEWRYLKHPALLAPLSLIKGVGEGCAAALRDEYVQRPWPDAYAFLDWADAHRRTVGAGALDALAQAGAFQTFKMPANAAVDLVRALVGFKESKANGTRAAQLRAAASRPGFFTTVQNDEVLAALEANAFGFNFWYSPWTINGRTEKVARLVAQNRIADEHEIKLHGKRRAFLVDKIRTKKDKKGGLMAFVDLTTPKGQRMRGTIFASVWKKCSDRVRAGDVYFVSGEFDERGSFLVSGDDPFRHADSVVA